MGMCASEKDSMQSITRDMLVSSKAPLSEYKPTFFIKTPNCPAFILNSSSIFSSAYLSLKMNTGCLQITFSILLILVLTYITSMLKLSDSAVFFIKMTWNLIHYFKFHTIIYHSESIGIIFSLDKRISF